MDEWKYCLWLWEQTRIGEVRGVLEYPKLRKTHQIRLDGADRKQIPRWVAEAERIVEASTCPQRLPKAKCKACSYRDFCWAEEESE